MALFSNKKRKEEKKAEKPAAPVKKEVKAVGVPSLSGNLGNDLLRVLRNPRITEKATSMQQMSVYTFDVAQRASKRQVTEAVRALYHVTPRKIAIVRVLAKKRRSARNGKTGISGGGKKAYVYLKAGETIVIH